MTTHPNDEKLYSEEDLLDAILRFSDAIKQQVFKLPAPSTVTAEVMSLCISLDRLAHMAAALRTASQPRVPLEMAMPGPRPFRSPDDLQRESDYARGWNACRSTMLASQQADSNANGVNEMGAEGSPQQAAPVSASEAVGMIGYPNSNAVGIHPVWFGELPPPGTKLYTNPTPAAERGVGNGAG